MKTCLLIVAVIALQISAVFTETKAPEGKILNEEIVSSADSKNDATHVKNEVENMREADRVGTPKDAARQDTPVPENTDERLDETDDESILNILNVQQERVDNGGKWKQDEEAESTKKDLSNNDLLTPFDYRNPPGQGWFKHRMLRKENQEQPLFMRESTHTSIIRLPLWLKLRRYFVRGLMFASSRRN